MRKLIAAINMTLDGFCDHTAVDADDELHQHFTDLLRGTDTILYGRITYQLMEYWPTVVKNPSGNKATDEFARVIDDITKIVYSRTLENVDWRNSLLKHEINKNEILELKKQSGKNILAGSPSLIMAMMRLDLVDEYQFVVHPVILGTGLPLFRNITEKIKLHLTHTKQFRSGAVVLCYQPVKS